MRAVVSIIKYVYDCLGLPGIPGRTCLGILFFYILSVSLYGQSQVFTSSGTFTVPDGVTAITVECWGAGGSGGGGAHKTKGAGGGAGGSYARKTLLVNTGESYTVTVAGPTAGSTAAGTQGGPSWFGSVSTVYAEGGAGGAAANDAPVAGGTGSVLNSIGDVLFPGGNGAGGTTTLSGGGGGGAGSGGAGGNASGTTPGTGTTLYGGNGGTGLSGGGDGATGSNYGGGGSGAYSSTGGSQTGGSGAQGLVVISMGSAVFNSSGTFTVPSNVHTIIVECWGAGGAGAGNPTADYGSGGGGGGAYARSVLTVTPGSTYTVTVGNGGTGTTGAGASGNPSWFGSVSTVFASGGTGGNSATGTGPGSGGPGGSSATSIGTVRFSGGNGGVGKNNKNNGDGGPGGSSACPTSNGVSGPATFVTNIAPAAPAGAGRGGDGGLAGTNGSAGQQPGGGGGGSGNGNRTGGNGAKGMVTVSWAMPVYYSTQSGDPNISSNWLTSDGYSPADFTSDYQIFIIQSGHTMTTSGSGWNVSGNGTMIIVRNGGVLTETTGISLSSSVCLAVEDGGVFNHNVNSVTIFSGIVSFHPTSMVFYGLSGAQAVFGTIYGNLTLAGSGIKTLGTVNVTGILSIESTATTAGTVPIFGAVASLKYKGSVSQTAGIEFPSTFTSSGGVIIDNSSGVVLNSDKAINSTLIFINGKITTGVNKIIMPAAATVTGAGPGKYINGNFSRGIIAGTTSASFEVGDASTYAPVTINYPSAITTPGSVNIKTTQGDHPNINTSSFDPAATVNRYWTITNSGVATASYNATFNFAATDIDAGADYHTFIPAYFSAAWSYPAAGTPAATSTQATGLTLYGDYQIGSLPSFRSRQTGNWNLASTWEYYNGTAWAVPGSPPTVTSGIITIRSPHVVTNTTALTIDQLVVQSGATLVLTSGITVNDGAGDDLFVSGTIDCSVANLTGAGSFFLNDGGKIIIGSLAGITTSGGSGSVQTGSRAFSQSGSYEYKGTSGQVTGNGLPSVVSNLIINNSFGVSLSSPVTMNGSLTLSAGAFSIGSNTLTFQNSDLPIIKSSGTITTSTGTSLTFGTLGNTAGAAFTLPSGTFTAPPSLNNLVINRINSLTLSNQMISLQGYLLCNGQLATNNNLTLLSTATQTAFIDGQGTGQVTGKVRMQRYLSYGYGYKYFSSPFSDATVSEFAEEVNLGSTFPLFYAYDENRNDSGLPPKFLEPFYAYVNPASLLVPAAGYAANLGTSLSPVTVEISGTVNNSSYSLSLYDHGNSYSLGRNLIGNPYPSAIDWNAPSGWTKTNLDDAVYFFQASTTDQWGGSYIGWVNGIPLGTGASNIIPSLQGFLVHPTIPGPAALSMDNRVRVSDQTQAFTKKSTSADEKSLIRISAEYTDRQSSPDNLVIYLFDKATPGFDSKYDALKFFNTDRYVPSFFAFGTDNSRLSIDGLPYPEASLPVIPLGIKTRLTGRVSIKLRDISGPYSWGSINLFDNITGITTDLSGGKSYDITLGTGEYFNRFFLNFSDAADTAGQLPERKAGDCRIYSSGSRLFLDVYGLIDSKALVRVSNVMGQAMFSSDIYETGHYEFDPEVSDGIYIVSLFTGSIRKTEKVFIHR